MPFSSSIQVFLFKSYQCEWLNGEIKLILIFVILHQTPDSISDAWAKKLMILLTSITNSIKRQFREHFWDNFLFESFNYFIVYATSIWWEMWWCITWYSALNYGTRKVHWIWCTFWIINVNYLCYFDGDILSIK